MRIRTCRVPCLLALLVVSLAACGGDPGDDAGVDAGPGDLCTADLGCDDGVFCNGAERCAPAAAGAGDDGCVAAGAPRCAAGQTCSEELDVCQTTCDADPDADGDGIDAAECGGTDCDDSDPLRFPGATEVCDAVGRDEDCDPSTHGERDVDGDGETDAACCNGTVCGTDCNDARRDVGEDGTEVCNAIDDDCDGAADEGVDVEGYADRDFDGYGAIDSVDPDGGPPVRLRACRGQLGFSELTGDCDDGDRARSPGLVEACDGVDNDCDGTVDDDTTAVNWYADMDGDGFGRATSAVRSCARPTVPAGVGWVLIAFDCDDDSDTVNPAAPEICDGLDNDCNGRADFVVSGVDTEDDDRDGVPDVACSPGGDCNDLDVTTYPGSLESCDMRDNDCNGMIDDGIVMRTWYDDADRDGDAEPGAASIVSCLDYRSTRALTAMDCDDTDPTIYGRAPEICDRKVNRCGGSNAGEDLDEDGFLAVGASCVGGPLATLPATDCDDGDAAIHPGAAETCNGSDDDCDTLVDVDLAAASCSATQYCRAGGCVSGRRVFITSTGHTGNLGGLAGGDAICQGRADAARLGGTWRAFLSTVANPATGLTRHTRATVPYYRLDGVRVANNWTDLTDGSLLAPLNVTELGTTAVHNVWTGMPVGGGGSNQHCDNWTFGGAGCLAVSGVACGGAGESATTDTHWDGYYIFACNSGYRLYCIEQ